MKTGKIIFHFILLILVAASIIPHLFSGYWLADIFSHLKVQYVVILMFLLLPIALYQVKQNLISILLILLLIIWNSWFIAPLYINDRKIAETSGESLSMLSMNLLASNTNYSKAIDLIHEKEPDIVILLELSGAWSQQFKELNAEFPFQLMYPQNDNFGIGIISKVPMIPQIINFGKNYPPSILAEFQVNEIPLTILATHPVPPVSSYKFRSRNMHLVEIARLSKAQPGNFILAGDLNTSSFSRHFQDLVKDGDLIDSRAGRGISTTWPSDLIVLRTTLDHILYKGEMQVLSRTTEENTGSDHLPVFMEIGF